MALLIKHQLCEYACGGETCMGAGVCQGGQGAGSVVDNDEAELLRHTSAKFGETSPMV